MESVHRHKASVSVQTRWLKKAQTRFDKIRYIQICYMVCYDISLTGYTMNDDKSLNIRYMMQYHLYDIVYCDMIRYDYVAKDPSGLDSDRWIPHSRWRAKRSDVYKLDVFVTSWRFHNPAWQPRRHDRLPETSGTLWIRRRALTNQRCSLATGCGLYNIIYSL